MNSKSRSARLAYVDLFAGPGRYKDGNYSTPIKVLQSIIDDPQWRRKFVTIFNDSNKDFVVSLSNEIRKLPNIESLSHKPIVNCSEVGDDLVSIFESRNIVPTLAFVDPWGYKGLSRRLINALIKDWGSDCLFFFNYNRINAGLTNPKVNDHMDSIFGEEHANVLRERIKNLSKEERELVIINDLAVSLSKNKTNYVLPFRFTRADGQRTSHYLIFVSKHHLGYSIMKEIMWKYSTDYDDGVANFSYINVKNRQLHLLFDYSRPLDTLGDELLLKYAGQTLTLQRIYENHNIGTPFVKANYKEALRRLEEDGKITTNPPAEERRIIKGKRSFADTVLVTFP